MFCLFLFLAKKKNGQSTFIYIRKKKRKEFCLSSLVLIIEVNSKNRNILVL